MRKFVKNFVKNNKVIYSIYNFIFSLFINILGTFVKIDDDMALFVVYGGKRYDDSPRFIYEYIKKHSDYSNIKPIWAFIEPDNFEFIPQEEKVKIDTLSYYKIMLKSKYWITNSSVQRGLNINEKKHINVTFLHGIAGIKKIGEDIAKGSKSFRLKKKQKFDMIFIGGKKEKNILIKALRTKEQYFYETGLPRYDELYCIKEDKVLQIKQKLNIPLDKKVILYAPTFREFYLDKSFNNIIESPFDYEKMREELSDEYILVVTAHYQVGKLLGIPQDNSFVINAFDYPHINDLLIIADILISDYSSVVWDYSILERPILCFAYDYDKYFKERGTYLDLNRVFYDGVIRTQEELVKVIKNMDFDKEKEHTKKLKEKFVILNKESAKEATEIIFKEKKSGRAN